MFDFDIPDLLKLILVFIIQTIFRLISFLEMSVGSGNTGLETNLGAGIINVPKIEINEMFAFDFGSKKVSS